MQSFQGHVVCCNVRRYRHTLDTGFDELLLVYVHSHTSVQLIEPELQGGIVVWPDHAAAEGTRVVGCEKPLPDKISEWKGGRVQR